MGKSATDVMPSVQIVSRSQGKDASSLPSSKKERQRKWKQLRALVHQLQEARAADELMIQQIRSDLANNRRQGVNVEEHNKLKEELKNIRQENTKLQSENVNLREQLSQMTSKHNELKNEIRKKKEKVNLAIAKCEKYKRTKTNLEARLQLCTCKMKRLRPTEESSREQSAPLAQGAHRPKRTNKKPKAPLATADSIVAEEKVSQRKDNSEWAVAGGSGIPSEITARRILAPPKKIDDSIVEIVQYWDEEELKARKAAEEAKLAEEEAKKSTAKSEDYVDDMTSSESALVLQAVVDTRIPGFFLQESPADAWKRRRDASALKRKQKQGRIRVHKDPWEDRFKPKKPQKPKQEPEFLIKAKQIGQAGEEYVVEASGAVEVGANVFVTKRGVEYSGQAAIEKSAAEKRAREEAFLREQEEEDERQAIETEERLARELEEQIEKKRRDEEERRLATENRAREIAEREREADERRRAEEEAATAKKAEQEAEAARKAAEEAAKKAAEAAAAPSPPPAAAAPAPTPPAPAPAQATPAAPAPAPPASAPAKKKKSFLDSDSSSDESDDSPLVKKTGVKKKSFFDSDSDSS